MPDATTQLEDIRERIDKLAVDAADPEESGVYLPEVGRVLVAGTLLDSVLMETRRRDRRSGSEARGGLDHSVPAGDRL